MYEMWQNESDESLVTGLLLVAYPIFSSLYRRYISDLILLANGIETNPGPAVADYINSSKTVCAPNSRFKYT